MISISFKNKWLEYNKRITDRNLIYISVIGSVFIMAHCLLDYYEAINYFVFFLKCRIISVIIAIIIMVLFLKKKIDTITYGYLAFCVPTGILSYNCSLLNEHQLLIYNINYSTAYVICSFLLTWHWKHTLNVILIFFSIYLILFLSAGFSLADLIKTGFLFLVSSAVLCLLVCIIRYYQVRSEFVLRYRLQLLNSKLSKQKELISDSNTNLSLFKSIIENSSDAILLIEFNRKNYSVFSKLYENNNFRKISRLIEGEPMRECLNLFSSKNSNSAYEELQLINEKMAFGDYLEYELNINTKFGHNILAETTILKLDSMTADNIIFALFINDVTIKKTNEEKRIKQSVQNYLYTINAVDLAQEKERERFARDLHDGLGQVLTSIKLNLNYLRTFANNDQNDIWQDTIHSISYSISEMRNIAYGIAPPSLVKYGLIPALKEVCAKSFINSQKPVALLTNVKQKISFLTKAEEVNVYRIIQESINNIVKHSSATYAELSIFKISKKLIVLISDNGVGFPGDKIDMGIGMNSIRARCEMLGASLSIKSESGTQIEVLLNKNKKNEN